VNERMHLAEMFRLTSYEEHLNIFHSLNPSEYDEARALIISLVLVTDIKVGEIKIWDFFWYLITEFSTLIYSYLKAWHLKLTGKIKAMIAGGRSKEVRNGGDEGLGFVLKTVMKLSDIGHTAKEMQVHFKVRFNFIF
jgi:hypothetical protein